MPDLAPLTAFGRVEPRRQRFGAMALAENTTLGLASLAVGRSDEAPQVMGLRLPSPGAWAETAGIGAFWMSPGQWMVAVENAADADLERDLRTALPDAAITGQTDGWVILEITSDAVPEALDRVMEKLVNLDPSRFGPGSATRTGLEHMSVFVIRRSPTTLAVLGMRSAAGTLWHALEAAVSRFAEARP